MTIDCRLVCCASLALVMVAVARPSAAQTPEAPRCGTGVHEEQATGTVFLPDDQIFCALLADPKEPRSFASFLRGKFRTLDDPSGRTTSIGSVGVADSFGLVRWGGPHAGEGVQLDVIGSVFAQFDLGSASNDLINADYVIGLPLTLRRSGFSVRAKVYHQSSHLGDEFLLRENNEIVRENLSFESAELLVSQEIRALRVYAGGERVFRRDPDLLPVKQFRAGVEVRSGRARRVQFVSGFDLKTTERRDWSPAKSARVGLELGRPGPGTHPGRLITLMLEIYDGPSPYGQFFQDDISYAGVGLHFGL